jgi:hypothetical protein
LLLAACPGPREVLQPLPPVTKTVYVYRPLPAAMMKPCDPVRFDPAEIVTDVDLAGLYHQEVARGDCNASKLRAIERLYRGAPE